MSTQRRSQKREYGYHPKRKIIRAQAPVDFAVQCTDPVVEYEVTLYCIFWQKDSDSVRINILRVFDKADFELLTIIGVDDDVAGRLNPHATPCPQLGLLVLHFEYVRFGTILPAEGPLPRGAIISTRIHDDSEWEYGVP